MRSASKVIAALFEQIKQMAGVDRPSQNDIIAAIIPIEKKKKSINKKHRQYIVSIKKISLIINST